MGLATQITNLTTIMEATGFSKIDSKVWMDYKIQMNMPSSWFKSKFGIVNIARESIAEDHLSGEFLFDIEIVLNILDDGYGADFDEFETSIKGKNRFFNLDELVFEFYPDYVVVRMMNIKPIITT